MKAGFIGLGHLGKTMAQRLISEGVDLTIWNRTKEKAEGLMAELADTPADLADKEDLIFLSLFNSGAVEAVLEDRNGLTKGNLKGKLIIDLTSNHFEVVNYFYKITAQKGATYLESPVIGSVVPAREGKLTILVSGERQAYERALPYLKLLGTYIQYLEKRTLATQMKLINNLLLGNFMASIAEALAFSESAGIERSRALDILANGAGNSAVLNAKKEGLLNDDFSPQFKCSLIYKDMHYLQDLAKHMKRPLLTGSVIKELFGMANTKGMEDMDFSAVYRIFKEF